MRGVKSHAMVLCASNADHTKVEFLLPPAGSAPGDRVFFEGHEGVPEEQLNPKKKVWETVQPDFATREDLVAVWKGVEFRTANGVVRAPSLAGASIKPNTGGRSRAARNYGFESAIDWRGKPPQSDHADDDDEADEVMRDYLANVKDDSDSEVDLDGDSMLLQGLAARGKWPISFLADAELGHGGFSSDTAGDANDSDEDSDADTDDILSTNALAADLAETGIHEMLVEAEDAEILAALKAGLEVTDSDSDQSASDSGDSIVEQLNAPVYTKSQRRKIAKMERRAKRDKEWQARIAMQEEASCSTLSRVSSAPMMEGQSRIARAMAGTKPGDALTPQIIRILRRTNTSMHRHVTAASGATPAQPPPLLLPPMPAALRRLAKQIAAAYGLVAKVCGSRDEKRLALYITRRSAVPDEWQALVDEIIAQSVRSGLVGNTRTGRAKKGNARRNISTRVGAPDDAASLRPGDIVGEGAETIGEDNLGHRMLSKLGWSPGETLGASVVRKDESLSENRAERSVKLTVPITVTVRARRRGLGAE
ncbi:hypothetical protein HDU84_001852 [Entophlyctis sp. JEL0112]|nr:hypothetical protein HDU84_001852 [Entophlyctis sp. JEL0112]